MRESIIEKHLVKRVKELGGEVRKVKWIGRTGAPDRVVMLPYKFMHATTTWVELKATGKEPTAGQMREHKKMRETGQRVIVFDSIEAIDKWLGFTP